MEQIEKSKDRKKSFAIFIILVAIGFLGANLLYKPELMWGHDVIFHIERLQNLSNALKNSQLRLYVTPDQYNNFGYGISMFYCDAMLYPFAVLVCLGVPLFKSYKLLLRFIFFAVAFTSYCMGYEISKDRVISVLFSLSVVCSQYFMTDVYIRDAVGECFGFVFIPLVIAGTYNLFYGDKNKLWMLIVGFSGLAMSHVLSFVLACFVFAAYLLMFFIRAVAHKKRTKNTVNKVFTKTVVAAIISFLLSRWFLLPMAEQLATTKFLRGVMAKYDDLMLSTVKVRHLFSPSVDISDFSPALGVIGLIYMILRIIYICKFKSDFINNPNQKLFFRDSLLVSLICIFMSTSLFPWNLFAPHINIIQFPWRLHIFSTILLCFTGSVAFVKIGRALLKNKYVISLTAVSVFIIGMFLLQCNYVYNYNMTNEGRLVYEDFEPGTDQNYLQANTKQEYFLNREKYSGKIYTVVNDLQGSCQLSDYGVHTVSFYDNNSRENILEMPINYYYGYKVTDEAGNVLDNFPSVDRGWLSVDITGYDSQNLTVVYEGTMLQKVSLLTSVITALALAIFWIGKFVVNKTHQVPLYNKHN